MAKLVLMRDNQMIQEIQLDKQDLTVGRGADNDITLDDHAVSRCHLRIITILNDSFMEDLNSTNGTYVNGKLTKKAPLADGDVVLVGRHQLKYESEAAAAGGDDDDFNKTRVMLPGQMGAMDTPPPQAASETGGMMVDEGSEEAAKVAAVEGYGGQAPVSQNAALKILSGAHAGKSLPLTKAMTNIGKAGQAVAAISRRPNGFFLVYTESGQGALVPTVNDQPLPPNGVQLQPGDKVTIGNIQMEFAYA